VQHREAGGFEHRPRHAERNRGVLPVTVAGPQQISLADELGGQRLVEDDVAAEEAVEDQQAQVAGRVAGHLRRPAPGLGHDEVGDELTPGNLLLPGIEVLDDLGKCFDYTHTSRRCSHGSPPSSKMSALRWSPYSDTNRLRWEYVSPLTDL